jgi:DNA-binding MarR family transcriptional regulator
VSAKHWAWVWEHSRAEGGTLLVALALADAVNHLSGDNECWPKQVKLSKYTRLSTRQVQRAVKELQALGEISVERHKNGNRYVMLMPTPTSGDILSPTPTSSLNPTPTSSLNPTPTSSSYVEPEVEPEREPESIQRIFSEWASLQGHKETFLSPARRRSVQKLLNEEPDADVLIQALRNFAAYAKQRGRDRWEISDAFSTFKGRDADGKPVFGDLRSRINWLLEIGNSSAQRSTAQIEQRMRDVGLAPARGYRWLEDLRYTLSAAHRPERQRGEEARRQLESYGFSIVELDQPPYARLSW